MSAIASQITSLTNVYSTVYLGADSRKHKSSVSLACVRGIRRWPVNSPHKGPVTRFHLMTSSWMGVYPDGGHGTASLVTLSAMSTDWHIHGNPLARHRQIWLIGLYCIFNGHCFPFLVNNQQFIVNRWQFLLIHWKLPNRNHHFGIRHMPIDDFYEYWRTRR